MSTAVRERDGNRCVACDTVMGPWSVHHRQLGNRDNNALSNLILLCGTGTTGCHGVRVHGSSSTTDLARGRRWASDLGYIVTRHGPRDSALHRPLWYNQPSLHRVGWYVLDDEGGIFPALDSAEQAAGIPLMAPAVTLIHERQPQPPAESPTGAPPVTNFPHDLLREARIAIRSAEDTVNRLSAIAAERRTDTDVASLLDATQQAISRFDDLDGLGLTDPDRPDPILPLTVRANVATVDLALSLSDVVFPGDEDKPEGLTLGHLVAARVAERIIPSLPQLAALAETILQDTIQAQVSTVVSRALSRRAGIWPEVKRDDLTLAQLIEAEVWRQVNEPDRNAAARGRSGVPVIEAVIATAVTSEFRDLAAGMVQQIRAKILTDIATSAGR